MIKLEREKFFDAIYDFLSETMDDEKAENQANIMVDNIIETVNSINEDMESQSTEIVSVSQKFHTLKNLLLYGDFYYESDLCQDIELELRKSRKIANVNVMTMYDELIDSLKL